MVPFVAFMHASHQITMPEIHSTLEIGQTAPPLVLPNLQGETISLASYRGKQNVILWFSRGYACPFCRQQMARLQLGYPKFKELGTEILQVAPGPLRTAKFYFMTHKLFFPYLVDDTFESYERYGLSDRGFPASLYYETRSWVKAIFGGLFAQVIAARYDIWGRQIIRRLLYHTFVAYEQGVFVVNRAGVVRFARVIGPIGNIPSNEELAREVDKLGYE